VNKSFRFIDRAGSASVEVELGEFWKHDDVRVRHGHVDHPQDVGVVASCLPAMQNHHRVAVFGPLLLAEDSKGVTDALVHVRLPVFLLLL